MEPWGGRRDSVARTLQIFVDPWTFVVLREAFFGVHRFDDFVHNLDISRNVLTKRLKHLVDNGIFERKLYQTKPDRYEYRLTDKGLDMYPSFLALLRWGDHWLAGPEGPPLGLYHEYCGKMCTPTLVCDHCGGTLRAREMSYVTKDDAAPREAAATSPPSAAALAQGRAK